MAQLARHRKTMSPIYFGVSAKDDGTGFQP